MFSCAFVLNLECYSVFNFIVDYSAVFELLSMNFKLFVFCLFFSGWGVGGCGRGVVKNYKTFQIYNNPF